MSRIGVLVLLLTIYLGFDIYTFYGLNSLTTAQSIFCTVYWTTTFLVFLGFVKVYRDLQNFKGVVRASSTNLLLGFGFAVIVAKVLFSGLLLVQDTGRLGLALVHWISGILSSSESSFQIPNRKIILTFFSAIFAGIPLISMLYGMTFGKYRYAVDKVKLKFDDLPSKFDGFKIVQISDIHSGSFDSVAQVKKGVDMIMNESPDLILFTGDLVNSHKDEIDPYIVAFATLSAPHGLFSVMGNHDYYGLYSLPKNNELLREKYMQDFFDKHSQMGFKILNNKSVSIEKEGQAISLLGVENWGAGPFPKQGDLDQALYGIEKNDFCVLMSHDPTHWDHHVLKHNKKIHLTLAGHTHGMQFGINVLGIKWSPVKYRYPRWMGLYEELDQYLYVNRGFGFLAWPGRVGMRPEITLIELGKV